MNTVKLFFLSFPYSSGCQHRSSTTVPPPILPDHTHHFVSDGILIGLLLRMDELPEADESHYRRPPWSAPRSNRDQPNTLGDCTITDGTPLLASSSLCRRTQIYHRIVFFSSSLFPCCHDHPCWAPSQPEDLMMVYRCASENGGGWGREREVPESWQSLSSCMSWNCTY